MGRRKYRSPRNKKKLPRYGLVLLGHRSHMKHEHVLRHKDFQKTLEAHEKYLQERYLAGRKDDQSSTKTKMSSS